MAQELHLLEHMTRVGAGCNMGCVVQKKHCGYLWTEYIFTICLSSKDASNLGEGVAVFNL